MALFVVGGSGVLNLSNQVFQGFEGISWQTTGDLHVILKDTQFNLLALPSDSIFQGSGFTDSVEIGISKNATFSGSSFTLQGWSVTDSFTFLDNATGNEIITGTQGSDRFVITGGIDQIDGNIGTDDMLVLRYGAKTGNMNGSATSITDFSGTAVFFQNIDRFNLTLGSGNDTVVTGAGYDVVRAGAGNDTINTGLGNAMMLGGAGNDQWIADFSTDNAARVINVNLVGVQQTGGGSSYDAIERLGVTGGAGNDMFITITGLPSNGLNDTLNGGGGNDTLQVGGGSDSVNGGAGANDVMIFDVSGGPANQAFFMAGSNNQFTNFSDCNVTFSSIERFDLRLSAGNDNLQTGAGADTVAGGAGNDQLNTAVGVAVIDGGTGNDLWIADFSGDASAKSINLTLAGIQAAGNGSTYASIERLGMTGGAGNDLFRTITGTPANGLNDTLNGGGGNDTLQVGGGSDSVIGGNGDDIMIFDVTGSPANQGFFMAAGDTQFTNFSDCNVTFSGIERFDLRLGAGNDNLLTGAGADTVAGGGGNDQLNTAAGVAVINGGAGTDLWTADFTGDATAKTINLNLNGVRAAGNGTTYVGIERMAILGGAGDDKLTSRVGNLADGLNDTMDGGAGNDRFVVGGGSDSVLGGDGTDDVLLVNYAGAVSSTNFNMFAGDTGITDFSVTQVRFSGIERLDLRFGAGIDTIVMGTGNDTFSGGAGNDTVTGGLGADLISGDAGNDVFVYRSTAESDTPGHRDTIAGYIVGQDRMNLSLIDAIAGGGMDDFTFMGSAAFTGLGQVRFTVSGGNTLVQMNTQGGVAAEMAIILQGIHGLTTADFIF